MKKVIFIIGTFILNYHYIEAYEENERKTTIREWQAGGMVHKGNTIKHSGLLASIIEHPAIGGEFFFSKQTYGAHQWNAFFNYPEYGICYSFFDLGSPDYVGTVQCLYPYLNFHFFGNGSRMNLHLRTGTGFAYVDKIYNAETNPLDNAFSTHLNVALTARLQGVYKISDTWSLFAGAGIMHLSNGAVRMPNLGLNTISFFMGTGRSFGNKRQFITPENRTNEKNRNWDCSFFFLSGIKEINPIGGKIYFAGDFNTEVTKRHLQYTRFGLSLDITYDASEQDRMKFQRKPAVSRLETTRIGVSGGYVWLLGDFSLNFFLGAYLHDQNTLYAKIYQRSSLRYSLSDRLKLSVAFRSNKAKADFIGLGLGYRLTK